MHHWFEVMLYGILAGVATAGGMSLVLVFQDWSRRHSAALVSYSAGVLLAVGILHVIPESTELLPHAPWFVLLSFVLFYFLEHHLFIHAGHEELHHRHLEVSAGHDAGCRNPHPLGVVAFAGMTLHSLIDGLIIGGGFEAGESFGLLAALGVIAHEVPEGVAMLSILLHYGYGRAKAILFTTLVACATPAAAIVTYGLIRDVAPTVLGGMMAMAGGSFVYIAASDLIPESHRARGLAGSLALCAGIATAIGAGLLAH